MLKVLIIGGHEPLRNLQLVQSLLVAAKKVPLIVVQDEPEISAERNSEDKLASVVALFTKRAELGEIEIPRFKKANASDRGLFGVNKRAIYRLKDNGKGRRR